MKAFCHLYQQLDETTKTNRKIAALEDYFSKTDHADAAWAVYLLSGRRMKRLVKHRDLRTWSCELAGITDWLYQECYDRVGDLAETIALLQPEIDPERLVHEYSLTYWCEERVKPLSRLKEAEQRQLLLKSWTQLETTSCFVFNKLITGGLRVGVSQKLLTKALARCFELPQEVIAHRMMGEWEPTPEFFAELINSDTQTANLSRPYPFCLAHALEQPVDQLGDFHDWSAEWKWDGIRAQLIHREGESFLWSRGEELLNERFPELMPIVQALPGGTVLDGEILIMRNGQVQPFAELQRRIGRKRITTKLLGELPAWFLAFDQLEADGQDIRSQSFSRRRTLLEKTVNEIDFSGLSDPSVPLVISELVEARSWDELTQIRESSRERGVEGVMLKHNDKPYDVGRVTGTWWKWKMQPHTIDAVLIYAQRGHGRRASLYSDYTFAVWDENEQLVPFAKAYSGLTDAEMRRVDRFIRQNTQEKFGPVRSVTPELVFEIAFENIQRSTRHKSGVAVRFPRILRWREDKKPHQADRLSQLQQMIALKTKSPASQQVDS